MLVPIDLPGPIVLVPGGSLEGKWRQQRRDHPHRPLSLGQVGEDLREMHAEGGVPATIAPPKAAGKDPSLLLYSRSYVLRLFASARRDAYVIAAIDPLRLTHHQPTAGTPGNHPGARRHARHLFEDPTPVAYLFCRPGGVVRV